MKYLFSLLLISVITFSSAQSSAKIVFGEEIFDFGELPEGPKVETEFIFTNTGSEPLIISNAKGSCGCTVPSWPKTPIAPGEIGVIKVVYNTARRPGNFTKTITLTSNAETPSKVIKIRGSVVKEVLQETMPVRSPLLMAPSN
tara:strand:- start:2298 stop:2726 length:429 start_codon:yes stop_codon:yes gene_type:complete